MCRSRRELSNAYLLAKFGFDTAENEPYYFEISSSREFEIELRKNEPLTCNPVDLSLQKCFYNVRNEKYTMMDIDEILLIDEV